jgi:hypothetical protein
MPCSRDRPVKVRRLGYVEVGTFEALPDSFFKNY